MSLVIVDIFTAGLGPRQVAASRSRRTILPFRQSCLNGALLSQSDVYGPKRAESGAGSSGGVAIALAVAMTNSSALLRARPIGPGSDETADVRLVVSLSRVLVDLHRYRQGAATARSPWSRLRTDAGNLETFLNASSRVPTSRRGAQRPWNLIVEVTAGAVASNHGEPTMVRATRRTNTAAVFDRPTKAIGVLEREAADLRSGLSPLARRAVELLERKSTLPLVSRVDGGACSECHLRLPTGLACSVAPETVESCPNCKRLLIADGRASSGS